MEDSDVGLYEQLCDTCSERWTLAAVVADLGATVVAWSVLVVVVVSILAVNALDVPATCLCRSRAVLVVGGVWPEGCLRRPRWHCLQSAAADPAHLDGCHLRIAEGMIRYRV